MKIGERLLKHVNKKYESLKMVAFRFGRYDVAMKTDEAGNPMLLFMGKADERGIIKGDQFARRLLADTSGVVLKDHWDYKGKV